MRWAEITAPQGLVWQVLQEQCKQKAMGVPKGQGQDFWLGTLRKVTCRQWHFYQAFEGLVKHQKVVWAGRAVQEKSWSRDIGEGDWQMNWGVVRLEKYFSNFIKPQNPSESEILCRPTKYLEQSCSGLKYWLM